ncbi:MAG: MerR family transcriptional regulator, partial [Chloroflexi bacterium]|nr:MerR family transcriptional regulator [Chloroflexota bacterium]
MSDSEKLPTFNMKVVVRETGLKPDTLRAWERRYGIPDPQRTPGGHRLYSQHEIDMLKWLVSRQADGMSISHAIELWHQQLEQGNDPLEDVREVSVKETILSISGDTLNGIRDAWLDACMAFDEYAAQNILAQAFAQFPMEVVCFDVLQKGLVKVGQGWYEGTVTVQQEHFTSALAIRRVDALLAAAPLPTRASKILVACPPNERHTFSPLLLALLFRRRGWDVVYLGADVPVVQLETAVKSIQPHLVILSAQTLITAGHLLPMASLLHTLNVPMAYGGAVFSYLPDVRKHIPGHFLGEQLQDVPDRVHVLLEQRKGATAVPSISEQYTVALTHFATHRAAIAASIREMDSIEGGRASLLNYANEDLGNNIEAALRLGDINLITASINWVHGLL